MSGVVIARVVSSYQSLIGSVAYSGVGAEGVNRRAVILTMTQGRYYK